MFFLVYCIASLFYYVFVLSSAPYAIYYPTVMAQYSLFVLKVSLNSKQTTKQTSYRPTNGIKVLERNRVLHFSRPGFEKKARVWRLDRAVKVSESVSA